jgi:DNA repair exonuclease SbcCD ATPase subunit
MNEVREQHEATVKHEAEFSTQHTLRLQELIDTGKIESEKLDTLKNTLGEAQTRLSEISEGSTSEDELRNHRSRERSHRDAVVTLSAERRQIDLRLSELDGRILAYRADDQICPECGQTITEDHAHEKEIALVTEKRIAMDRLFSIQEEIPKIELELSEITQGILSLDNQQEQSDCAQHQDANNSHQPDRVLLHHAGYQKAEGETNPLWPVRPNGRRTGTKREERETLITQEDAVNADIEILKFWQKGYRDIRLEQIDSTLLELELATNRNATALGLQDWEIQFATERETKSGSVSHAFSIFLFPPGQSKPVTWDSYSGGEAQRWQLAVTFGLSEVLLSRAGIEPDIEIYDEPTGFLSQEGIDDLLECLHTRAHELQRRIYLIDHRSLERGSFDGIVTVVKTDAGIRIDAN